MTNTAECPVCGHLETFDTDREASARLASLRAELRRECARERAVPGEIALSAAAAQLGVQPATLRQQIAAGRLQATKMGRDWWVTTKALEAYRSGSLGKVGRPVTKGKAKA